MITPMQGDYTSVGQKYPAFLIEGDCCCEQSRQILASMTKGVSVIRNFQITHFVVDPDRLFELVQYSTLIYNG